MTGIPGPELSRGRRWAALAVLTASLLVITMDMTILNIALPDMAADLHPTSDQQLWIIDVYSLVLAGLLVSWAAIGDRWGRKRMLMLGYLIFAVASVLVLFADSAGMVIAIRAFLGVGGAMIMPTTLSLIRVIFTDAGERAAALGVWAAVSGLGAAVGPLVGGLLLEHFSWHAAFLINVPLMLVAIIAGIWLLPESRVSDPGRWDALGAALSLVGMVALVWSIKQFGKYAALDLPEAWMALGVAVATLAWFTVRCLRSDKPLLDLGLFENRRFSAGIIAALGSTFSLIAVLLLVVQWLQLVDGATALEAGVRLIPIALASAAASMLAPPLSGLLGARAVLAGGLVFSAAGMLLIGLSRQELDLTIVLVSLVLVGAGTGSLAIGSALIMSGSPEEKAGNAGALEETSYELGGTLGVAVLGSISALIYRSRLVADEHFQALQQVEPELAGQVKESLGAAVSIADGLGQPELAAKAGDAFTRSLEVTGLVGGALMLLVAVLVFAMVPKGTSVAH